MHFIFGCRFVAAHLVGRRLIYPGSLELLNGILCECSMDVMCRAVKVLNNSQRTKTYMQGTGYELGWASVNNNIRRLCEKTSLIK